MFLNPDEAITVVQDYLDMFRESLYILSRADSKTNLNWVIGSSAKQRPVLGEDRIVTAQAVVNYIYARNFFFKEKSGFHEMAGLVEVSPVVIRESLREEETTALMEGGLDEVNLHKVSESLPLEPHYVRED